MKLRLSVLAVLAAAPALTNAAALDRSGQSVAPFFQKGNYAEVGYTVVDPSLPGKEAAAFGGGKTDAAEQYSYRTAAVKFEPQKNVRVAVLYDEPFGVDYAYRSGALYKGSSAIVDTQNITTLVGSTLAPNFWVYTGLAFEDLTTDVTLSGAAFVGSRPGQLPAPYNVKFDDSAVGYVGGLAYEVPSIALRAALTYRSVVEHDTTTTETIGGAAVPGRAVTIETPQSVNLDFQTGINPTTLLMANVRWVEWSAFKVTPRTLGGRSLTNYQDDQISGSIGLGKKITDNFSGLVRVGYDTGTGEKGTSPFGAYTERAFVGVGGKYKFNKNVDGTLGVAYVQLGDGATKDPTETTTLANYNDNEAIAVTAKLGFHF